MHQAFHPAAAVQFQPQERKATLGLLLRLLDEPDGLMSHLRLYVTRILSASAVMMAYGLVRMTGETIMSITYGLDVLPKDDPYLTTIERGIASLVSAAAPGAFLVNSIPVLKYVPEWMPFADFKRKAKEGRRLSKAVVDHPFSATKRNIVRGSDHIISFAVAEILTKGKWRLNSIFLSESSGEDGPIRRPRRARVGHQRHSRTDVSRLVQLQ